jgi:autotransporter family porin
MVAATTAGLLAVSGAQALVTTTGSISPNTHPSSWTESTNVYVGYTADGTLTIADGTILPSYVAYIGYAPSTTGTVVVDGSGSSWTNTGDGGISRYGGSLYVGYYGTGSLGITNGGTVASTRSSWVGWSDGGSGAVTVNGAGSNWSTPVVYLAAALNSSAVVNVVNGGMVSATPRIAYTCFESSHTEYEILNPGSRAAVTIDGVGSTWYSPGSATVGDYGTGSLTITNGGTYYGGSDLEGHNGGMTIGMQQYSVGTVTVDGAGSTLNSGYYGIIVGYDGHGSLIITNGGKVTGSVTIGFFNHASQLGTVTVNGASSSLMALNILKVGDYSEGISYGRGRLSVTDGGSVTTPNVIINGNTGTVLTADVGRGSSIIVGGGTGTITNYGKIRLVAGASAASGTYTPMQYASMSGSGTVQALGGVWNDTAHTVTVSGAAMAAGIGGATAAFNLAVAQRAIITDSATGNSVGAGFQADTANVTFSAAALSPTALAALQSLLASGTTVLSAWNFSTTGYAVDDSNPVYLSLSAGSDQSLSGLRIWHYDGSTWSAYDAYDLAYDGTYASFTVTGLSGYAVTTGGATPTPTPAAVWLLGSGITGLGFLRRRVQRRAAADMH